MDNAGKVHHVFLLEPQLHFGTAAQMHVYAAEVNKALFLYFMTAFQEIDVCVSQLEEWPCAQF